MNKFKLLAILLWFLGLVLVLELIFISAVAPNIIIDVYNSSQLIQDVSSGGNSSWNESLAHTLFDSTYNATYNAYVTANMSNSTTWWNNMNSTNSTQITNSNGIFTILESWLTSFGNLVWCKLTGCNMVGNINSTANITTTGMIGIGTEYPNFYLDIQGSTNKVLGVRRTSSFDMIWRYLHTAGSWTNYTENLSNTRGTVTGDLLDHNSGGILNDYIYLGKSNTFNSILIDLATAKSAGGNLTLEYSTTGSTWDNVSFTDTTNALTLDGIINFTAPIDWSAETVNGVDNLYWVRIGTNMTTYTVEPTAYLIIPSTNDSVLEFYGNKEDTTGFIIDQYGYLDLTNVDTFTALGGITIAGALSGGTTGSFTTSVTTPLIVNTGTAVALFNTSTANQRINIGTGITVSGSNKTINIGTNGASGSNTNITIGSAVGNSNLFINGQVNISENLTVSYICNSTNCYSLEDFLIQGSGNSSWNESGARGLFALNTTESIQSLVNNSINYSAYSGTSNSTTWWNNMNSTNSTQIENNGGTFNIKESWLNAFGWITNTVSNLVNYYTKTETDTNLSLRYLNTNPSNFINSTNVSYVNNTNNFTANQIFSGNVNITGNISLGDSVITRDNTNVSLGISSSGTVVERLG